MIGKFSTNYSIFPPLNFKWAHADDKYGDPSFVHRVPNDVVIYTDMQIMRQPKIGKVKIAWLLEPPEYEPKKYEYIKQNYREFDYIFTWDKNLLEIDSRFILYTTGNSWIPRDEIAIYSKDKLLSMSASWKKFMSGHAIRHQILDRYMKSYNIHWFGKRGLNPADNYIAPFDPTIQNTITNLIDAYKDYMFTIVVENQNLDYMFSEKLVSPILCGTIPIYYGMPSIDKFFDTRGMIIFDSIDELDDILSNLSLEKYEQMLPYARINFERAKGYQLLEDGIYDKLVEMKVLT
jgi:hypothetical protein